jgi:chorismate synthase
MNSFGRLFRISIFGESHGEQLGILIDGTPPGIKLYVEDFLEDIDRRKGGKYGTTSRVEEDFPEIKSGVLNNFTTGAPILIIFKNENLNSENYTKFRKIPRPGHADFTASKKFINYNDLRGGGHFSGRLTLALVAAGVIAKKIIHPIEIKATIKSISGNTNIDEVLNDIINSCDTYGGIIECTAQNVPVGLGEPFFDSVESLLSHIIFSIPAIKGIEFGSGFKAAEMTGSLNNDLFINNQGKTITNNSGGINGGITNGNEIIFRVAVKPASSISLRQKTINMETNQTEELIITGRHDKCIALRMPVIIEGATAIVLADFIMINNHYCPR